MKAPLAIVILAAGAGTRMKSALPKVLHPLAGWPIVRHVIENARRLKPARIVVSPGPCTPNEAGVSVPLIKTYAGKIPILGVCLGHQSIGQAFGGKVVRAPEPMHGKISAITHTGHTMFAGVLLGGLIFGRLFIKLLLGQTMQLPDDAWRVLTWRWSAFFLALAIANEFVWRNTSTNLWVAFKVWGVFPLTILFALSQTPFIARHQIEPNEPPPAA